MAAAVAPGGAETPLASGAGEGSPGAPGMTALPGMAEQALAFGEPTWTAPEGWAAQPLGSVRKGSWKIAGPGGQAADVAVTVFPGDVGGPLANVNRWRGQIGLFALEAAQLPGWLEHVDVGDAHGELVRLEGPGGQAILGALVPRSGGTWFFKLQGDAALVQAQAGAFREFLGTVAFPEGPPAP